MKESKAINVTKKDINLYSSNILNKDRIKLTNDVGIQYNSKKNNSPTHGLKESLRVRKYYDPYSLPRNSLSPKQIYMYSRSRSYTDVGVGSVFTLPKKKVKVKRIYLPETSDRGVGGEDISSFIGRKPKYGRGFYETKQTSSKCVGGTLCAPDGVVSAKLSPIIQMKSGTTSPQYIPESPRDSPRDSKEMRTTSAGSHHVDDRDAGKADSRVKVSKDSKDSKDSKNSKESKDSKNSKESLKEFKDSKESSKGSKESKESKDSWKGYKDFKNSKDSRYAKEYQEMKTTNDSKRAKKYGTLYIKDSPNEEPKIETESPRHKQAKKGSFSSDSLLENIHNLDQPSDHDKLPDDITDNKMEKQYKKIFATKSKYDEDDKDKIPKEIEKKLAEKSTSLFRRRITALRKSMAKKESIPATPNTEEMVVPSVRDVSITSDPPSLEGHSFSSIRDSSRRSKQKPAENFPRKASTYKKPAIPGSSKNWPNDKVVDSEYGEGVKGMFKLWGRKFNLDESSYRKEETAYSSYDDRPREKGEGDIKDPDDVYVEEETSNERVPEQNEKDVKKKNKFFFFKKKTKEKPKEAKPPAVPSKMNKKGTVTTGRCEIKDGFTLKVGVKAQPPSRPTSAERKRPKSRSKSRSGPMTSAKAQRTAWLMKYLTGQIESKKSVNVRWYNKMYTTSSSTMFELMEDVYKDTDVVLESRSEISTDTSVTRSYRSHQRAHFRQRITAYMMSQLVTDNPVNMSSNPVVSTSKNPNSKNNNTEVTISYQKCSIDKSKAFANKIEIVLHSNNFVKLNYPEAQGISTSKCLRIDLPHDFFSRESEDPSQTSEEQVCEVTEYELDCKPSSEKQKVSNLGDKFSKGDATLAKDIEVTISVQDKNFGESQIYETIISRPPHTNDVYNPKKCDVIGVGIFTQNTLSEADRPFLKITEYISEDESQVNIHRNRILANQEHLYTYESHYALHPDMFVVSDCHLQCCDDHKPRCWNPFRSFRNLYDYLDYDIGSKRTVARKLKAECLSSIKIEPDTEKQPIAEIDDNDDDEVDEESDVFKIVKDSIDVFKDRKVRAQKILQWYTNQEDDDYPYHSETSEVSRKSVLIKDEPRGILYLDKSKKSKEGCSNKELKLDTTPHNMEDSNQYQMEENCIIEDSASEESASPSNNCPDTTINDPDKNDTVSCKTPESCSRSASNRSKNGVQTYSSLYSFLNPSKRCIYRPKPIIMNDWAGTNLECPPTVMPQACQVLARCGAQGVECQNKHGFSTRGDILESDMSKTQKIGAHIIPETCSEFSKDTEDINKPPIALEVRTQDATVMIAPCDCSNSHDSGTCEQKQEVDILRSENNNRNSAVDKILPLDSNPNMPSIGNIGLISQSLLQQKGIGLFSLCPKCRGLVSHGSSLCLTSKTSPYDQQTTTQCALCHQMFGETQHLPSNMAQKNCSPIYSHEFFSTQNTDTIPVNTVPDADKNVCSACTSPIKVASENAQGKLSRNFSLSRDNIVVEGLLGILPSKSSCRPCCKETPVKCKCTKKASEVKLCKPPKQTKPPSCDVSRSSSDINQTPPCTLSTCPGLNRQKKKTCCKASSPVNSRPGTSVGRPQHGSSRGTSCPGVCAPGVCCGALPEPESSSNNRITGIKITIRPSPCSRVATRIKPVGCDKCNACVNKSSALSFFKPIRCAHAQTQTNFKLSPLLKEEKHNPEAIDYDRRLTYSRSLRDMVTSPLVFYGTTISKKRLRLCTEENQGQTVLIDPTKSPMQPIPVLVSEGHDNCDLVLEIHDRNCKKKYGSAPKLSQSTIHITRHSQTNFGERFHRGQQWNAPTHGVSQTNCIGEVQCGADQLQICDVTVTNYRSASSIAISTPKSIKICSVCMKELKSRNKETVTDNGKVSIHSLKNKDSTSKSKDEVKFDSVKSFSKGTSRTGSKVDSTKSKRSSAIVTSVTDSEDRFAKSWRSGVSCSSMPANCSGSFDRSPRRSESGKTGFVDDLIKPDETLNNQGESSTSYLSGPNGKRKATFSTGNVPAEPETIEEYQNPNFQWKTTPPPVSEKCSIAKMDVPVTLTNEAILNTTDMESSNTKVSPSNPEITKISEIPCNNIPDSNGDPLIGNKKDLKPTDEDALLEKKQTPSLNSQAGHQEAINLQNNIYKTPEIPSAVTVNKVESVKRQMPKLKSENSVANEIEINFKLRVTQGDKTTEIKINNDEVGTPKQKSFQSTKDKDVYILNPDGKLEHDNNKNDLNIRIVIKNYKSKPDVNQKSENPAVTEFSNKISQKFNTVSTGYGQLEDKSLYPATEFSIHRATVQLSASDKLKVPEDTPSFTLKSPQHSDKTLMVVTENSSKTTSFPCNTCSTKTSATDLRSNITKSELVTRSLPILSTPNIPSDSDSEIESRVSSQSKLEAVNEKTTSEGSIYKSGRSTKSKSTKSVVFSDTEDIPDKRTSRGSKSEPDLSEKDVSDIKKPLSPTASTVSQNSDVDDTRNDEACKSSDDEPAADKSDEDEDTDVSVSKVLNDVKSENLSLLEYNNKKLDKKNRLKQMLKTPNYFNKPKSKSQVQLIKNILKELLSSESDTTLNATTIGSTTKELVKDITCWNDLGDDSDSPTNMYKESYVPSVHSSYVKPKYPSCVSKQFSALEAPAENKCNNKCMCSTFAEKLLGNPTGGCGCRKQLVKHDQSIECKIKSESIENFSFFVPSVECIHVQTRKSFKSSSNSTQPSIRPQTPHIPEVGIGDEIEKKPSVIDNFKNKDSKLEAVSYESKKYLKKKKYNDQKLGISDNDEIMFLEAGAKNYTRKREPSKKKTNPKSNKGADLLQMYETKKAVLKIYAEKTITEKGEHFVAKLPKYVRATESHLYQSFEKMENHSYLNENVVMMCVKR